MTELEQDQELIRLRGKLISIAYRMLGTLFDAEDAVQDAFVRFQRAEGVESKEGWLVRTTTRVCIDRLRDRKRRGGYRGPWLPEPLPENLVIDKVQQLEVAESLTFAFMVMLEALSPTERAVYLLREIFGYDFEEIAAVVGKTAVNVRQIAVRARKRLESGEQRFWADQQAAKALAQQFFEACQSGDIASIEKLLAGDVVYLSDGGGNAPAAPRPLIGTGRIARLLEVVFRKHKVHRSIQPCTVNGFPGLVVRAQGMPVHVITIAADDEHVRAIYSMLNPEKLKRWLP